MLSCLHRFAYFCAKNPRQYLDNSDKGKDGDVQIVEMKNGNRHNPDPILR